MQVKTAEAMRKLASLTSATVRHMTSMPIDEEGLAQGVTGTLDGLNAVDTGVFFFFFFRWEGCRAQGSRQSTLALEAVPIAVTAIEAWHRQESLTHLNSHHALPPAGLAGAFKPLYDTALQVSTSISQTRALLLVVGTEWNAYSSCEPREGGQAHAFGAPSRS